MTDFAGTEKPTGTDEKPRKPKASGGLVSPTGAGVAAPVALQGVDPVADLPFESAPEADTAKPPGHAHPNDHDHGPQQRGVMDGIRDALRGLFGRKDK